MPVHELATAPSATSSNAELHICSLVVHALPSRLPAVHEAITNLYGSKIHAVAADGRMAVTLETTTEADFLRRFAEIERLTGVVSTMLVFHQVVVESG